MILIADDDNAIRLSLSMLLRKAGHDVKTVGSPAEVIEKKSRNKKMKPG